MRVIRLFMNKVDQERKVMSTRSNQETVTALAVSIERGAAMGMRRRSLTWRRRMKMSMGLNGLTIRGNVMRGARSLM